MEPTPNGESLYQIPPLFSENHVCALAHNDETLAICEAYSLDFLSLERASSAIAMLGHDLFLARKLLQLSPLGYSRLVQEIAEKISKKKIIVPPQVRSANRGYYVRSNDITQDSRIYYSELLDIQKKKSALLYWRSVFSEDDIRTAAKNEMFMVCLDIYRANKISINKIWTELSWPSDYHLFELSPEASLKLIFEICSRMNSGGIVIEKEMREKYEELYKKYEI